MEEKGIQGCVTTEKVCVIEKYKKGIRFRVKNHFIYTDAILDYSSARELEAFINKVYQLGFNNCGTMLMNK